MPAYWIAHAKINDPVEYKKYTDQIPDIMATASAKWKTSSSMAETRRRAELKSLYFFAGVVAGLERSLSPAGRA